MLLCHLLTPAGWEAAQAAGTCAPAELARDGFLHCCTPEQVAFVAARHFPGRSDMLVLRFDPALTGTMPVWVASEPDQAPFPHLHGPILLSAVVDVWLLAEVLGRR